MLYKGNLDIKCYRFNLSQKSLPETWLHNQISDNEIAQTMAVESQSTVKCNKSTSK